MQTSPQPRQQSRLLMKSFTGKLSRGRFHNLIKKKKKKRWKNTMSQVSCEQEKTLALLQFSHSILPHSAEPSRCSAADALDVFLTRVRPHFRREREVLGLCCCEQVWSPKKKKKEIMTLFHFLLAF